MNKELKHNWRYEKILIVDEAREKALELKEQGKKIVTTNGVFDIMHAGHLDALEEYKKQGDVLFIGLNSDKSVREGKGEERPYIPEVERAAMLAALVCVDYVLIIDALYKEVQDVLLRAVKPDIHGNLDEYGEPDNWIEWPVMQEVGAQGYVCKRRPGLSTSDIIEKIKSKK